MQYEPTIQITFHKLIVKTFHSIIQPNWVKCSSTKILTNLLQFQIIPKKFLLNYNKNVLWNVTTVMLASQLA